MTENSHFICFVVPVRRASLVLMADSKSPASPFNLSASWRWSKLLMKPNRLPLPMFRRVRVSFPHPQSRCGSQPAAGVAGFAHPSVLLRTAWSQSPSGMGTGWPTPAPSPFSLPFSPLVLFIAPGRRKPNFHRKPIGWGNRQKDRERWGQRRKTEPSKGRQQGGRKRAEEGGGEGKEAEQGAAVAGFPSGLHKGLCFGS